MTLSPRHLWPRFAALLVFAALGVLPARPQAIEITIATPAGDRSPVSLGGDNISALISQAVGKEADLRGFEGRPISADVGYLGVANALQIQVSADGAAAELYFPLTGERAYFGEANAEALQNRVEKYLRSDGSSALAAFRREVNKRSAAGVTDGNPLATTALLSRSLYRSVVESKFDSLETRPSAVSATVESSSWSAGNLSGRTHALLLKGEVEVTQRGRWLWSLPIDYRSVGQAQVWGGSLGSSLAIELLPLDRKGAWSWTAGPVAGAAMRGSEELGAGGALYAFGINSSLSRDLGSNVRIGVVAQASRYEGVPVDFEGFELDSEIDQSIAELGGHLVRDWGGVGLRASITGSSFLQSAGVRRFGAIRLGMLLPLGQQRRLELQLVRLAGGGFEDSSARLGIRW